MVIDELDLGNKFCVGVSGARLIISKPPRGSMSLDDAVNLAAWLVALADPFGEKFKKAFAATGGILVEDDQS